MSCPTGTEVQPFINFLRSYSKRNKNQSAVDSLCKGIHEWQRLQKKQNKLQSSIENKHSRLATSHQIHLFRSLSRLLAAMLVPVLASQLRKK